MSNTPKFTQEIRFVNKEFGAKIDIKGICQKFENLSSVTENAKLCDTSTPIPPVRKRKSKNESCFEDYERTNTNGVRIKKIPVNNHCSSKNIARNSVKERTKLFESPTVDEKFMLSANRFSQNNWHSSPLPVEDYKIVNSQSKNFEYGNINSANMNTPPAKPPRSFLHSEIDIKSRTNITEISNTCSVADIKVSKENLDISAEHKSRDSSFKLETKSLDQIYKNSKTVGLADMDSIKKYSTPKLQKFSGKTQTIFNYFKNISSSANNFCEKVKQKHSIFVDLTPTTISPPKHYGTLKRSLSEEHIYAEPVSVRKSDSNKYENDMDEPLHYMCTSVIPPNVPVKHKTEGNTFNSRQSVRNMIYGSFAGLRAVAKENSEDISNNPALDNNETDVSMKAIQARIIYVKSVRKQASSSSLCLAPKLYEALFIVNVQENQPVVSYSFPLKIADEYKFPLLPHICFPDNSLLKTVSVYQSETFHFTLADKDETVFGYCLRIQGWPETGLDHESLCVKLPVAVCILSSFYAPVFYKKLLIEIENHLTLPRNKCFKYIRSLQKLGVPNAGASLSVPDCTETEDANRTVISRPLDSHFVGLEMTRALQLLDVDILVKCVASLFLERRILFFSARTSNLYHCCKAVSSLLYPFEWPHLIVPVLPACLTIHCCSEQPYVLGIVNTNCDSVLELLAEHELLIIDIDKGAIIKSCNDEDTILPRKVQKAVTSALNLAKNMTDPTEMLRDIMISEAFVHMSVEMIGHYENHFVDVNGNMTFQKEGFLKNAFSHNIRSFLQWFSETQMFDTFIEESLWRIRYRNICQTNMRTFFEKRVDEYKWELSHGGEKLSRIIGKTVKNFGEIFKGLKKN